LFKGKKLEILNWHSALTLFKELAWKKNLEKTKQT